jgi:hypothetical protein
MGDYVLHLETTGGPGSAEFTTLVAVCDAVERPPEAAHTFQLENAYPNPFNSTTTIAFDLPAMSEVHLVLTDILGRQVEELLSGSMSAGPHRFTWNANDLPSGTYFARLETRFGTLFQKLLLLK